MSKLKGIPVSSDNEDTKLELYNWEEWIIELTKFQVFAVHVPNKLPDSKHND